MTSQEILSGLGTFSDSDIALFEKYTARKILEKNEVLLRDTEVCKSLYYVLSGSFYQFQTTEAAENIIDLHLQGEWMFNQQSLTEQSPSTTTIKSFSTSELIEISLQNFHWISSQSPSFLQFGKILNQSKNRTFMYDSLLTPTEKYHFIINAKPEIVKVFPVKMIASYLKMAPETLSRVRASF
jgi:CRP-like cAMP-binding protein